MPVSAIPLMKYRCKQINTKSTGTRTTTDPAINSPHSVLYCPLRFANATGKVYIVSLVMIIRGHKNSFHEPINVKIASVARAGLQRGSMIFQ